MSKRRRRQSKGGKSTRRISVRSVRREQPDLHKLSRALIRLAMEQAAAEAAAKAQAEGEDKTTRTTEAADD
ncbi:hypothetical protein [Geodermatophilus sp. DSM 45219]|uniref:hypothetical protein n=1 Tax=Geodermatophilus sp. DSM 45219 TaxID=1881103 RepID=UPI0008832D02|nr:hypothetical protein [Geodermatophilus sp. DSM 45219]SDN38690.1 hypothetical protein SAMN05428965_0157 [Geodermatophilus sp. DSM 45219]